MLDLEIILVPESLVQARNGPVQLGEAAPHWWLKMPVVKVWSLGLKKSIA